MPHFDKQKSEHLGRLLERIRTAVYRPIGELNVEVFVTPEPLAFDRRTEGRRLEIKAGDVWASAVFDCGWFHFTGVLPTDAAGAEVVLLIDVNGEACVVDSDGTPRQGLTNINSEFDKSLGVPGKRVVPFVSPARGGEKIDLWADGGANDLFGRMQEKGTLKQACMAIRNPQLYALQWDWEVLHELMVHLPMQSARRSRLWDALLRAAAVLVEFTDAEATKVRAILAPELAKAGGDPSLTISAVGHAHMDLAWLWPVRETIRKCARTFATVLRMMERYPDYVFGASQPQQYQWVKDHYPKLYAQVKKRVAEGRWEAQGAMWVEPDTNVPSGESLVRQIVYGMRFFREDPVGTGCVWIQRSFAADSAQERDRLLHDPEAVVEPGDQAPASHVLVAGGRRLARAGAHAAGGYVQRSGCAAVAGENRAGLSGQKCVRSGADAVRHR